MSFVLAQAYLKDEVALNEVAKASLLTGDLEANQVKFLGANTVQLPKISFTGAFGDYSRTTGFTNNPLNLGWDEYTLTQDKGNSLKLDAMDDEEGLGQALVPFVNQYIRTIEVPAIDKYRLGVLATDAHSNNKVNVGVTISANTIVSELLGGFEALKNAEFPEEGLILYITTAVDSLLQKTTELSRYIRVDEVEKDGVYTKVRYFNGAKIVVVPSGRFPSGVHFLLVHPSAQLSVVKHRPSHFYPEGTVPGFDGSQVDIRVYHDTFVIEQRNKGIYVGVADAK